MKNSIFINENIIVVNKNIKPNESIQVNGQIFIDTRGINA